MKLSIIIGQHGSDMINSACIPEGVLKGMEDGDKVTAKVSGVIVEREGKRYIDIQEVDGEPVEKVDLPPKGDPMDMDSEDALNEYMKEKEAK